jgi:hypothetical protein
MLWVKSLEVLGIQKAIRTDEFALRNPDAVSLVAQIASMINGSLD